MSWWSTSCSFNNRLGFKESVLKVDPWRSVIDDTTYFKSGVWYSWYGRRNLFFERMKCLVSRSGDSSQEVVKIKRLTNNEGRKKCMNVNELS